MTTTPIIFAAEYRVLMGLDKPKATPGPSQLKRVGTSEHDEQCALLDMVHLHMARIPELAALYAIPNQRRSKGEAGRLKAEGARAGVWDLHLPVRRAPYNGLWIEMKVGKNTLSQEQRKWQALMRSLGHRCEVCYSAEEAWLVLRGYLAGEGATC